MQPVQKKPKSEAVNGANDLKYAKVGKAAPDAGTVIANVRPRPSQEITNPKTETVDWGFFPGVDVKTRVFPAGPIRLRYGEHKGPKRGYGLAHIWEAHFKSDELNTPMQALPVIADFVSEILRAGAQIIYEYGNGRAGDKSTVFKSRKGVVIIEERQDAQNNTFYSIVTAFPGTKVHGKLVGTLK